WKDGKRMSPAEIAKSEAGRFMRADQFENEGITLSDNTPQEIKTVALEMAAMIEGRMHPGPQTAFWSAYPRSNADTGYPLHGEIRMRIGSKFLTQYEDQQATIKQLASIGGLP
ncbi:MAG: hypothetical protein WAW75_04530, partial [Gallionella sp.]